MANGDDVPFRESLKDTLRELIFLGARIPIAGSLIENAQTARFNAAAGPNVGLFNGVYASFAEAERAIPPGRARGYDNELSASRLLGEWLEITPSDYPALFWLAQTVPNAQLVFDWGGNVGLKYFAYSKYLAFPKGMTWCVNDVGAVVSVGRQIAAREAAEGLQFTTELENLERADVLYAAGTIHFIEDPIELLEAAAALPPHIILGKVPVYDSPSAVTLQNIGTAFCPNHLFNRRELIGDFEDLGYQLIDSWTSPEMNCEIPFYPNHSIHGYSGFYFRKSETAHR